jgi:hypothetical protein
MVRVVHVVVKNWAVVKTNRNVRCRGESYVTGFGVS